MTEPLRADDLFLTIGFSILINSGELRNTKRGVLMNTKMILYGYKYIFISEY